MGSLYKLLVKRFAMGLGTIIIISLLIFLGVEMLPGDTAQAVLGMNATPENLKAFREELKLDIPPHIRYLEWLGDFLKGDFGNSLITKRPVIHMIDWRLKNTLFLALMAAAISIPLALILGIIAAFFRDSLFDRIISVFSLSAVSIPEFFVAYMLIALFSVKLNLFPAISFLREDTGFWERVYILILPCVTLALVVMAHMMRMTRAAILNVMSSPYIEMAHLKGIKRSRIIIRHALPNGLSPIINVIILDLAWLIAGVVIVEVVFVYPGLGQLMVDSVTKRDIPVVQASGLIFATTYVVLNLVADVLSLVTNPRLLHHEAK